MADIRESLPWEDRVSLSLRRLYEDYGYSRYRMARFEPYDLYRENRNFLDGGAVLTFTDPSGRLMALKPDVTMSIVKNLRPETRVQKLYYVENVFRLAHGTREYREIGQIGVESIGAADLYAQSEVLTLAEETLAAVDGAHLLCLSSMRFIAAVFAACGFSPERAHRAMKRLRRRSLGELEALCREAGASPWATALLLGAAKHSGAPEEVLPAMAALSPDEEMAAALRELEDLCAIVKSPNLRLDFTMLSDLDYYNGIVFQGFVRGLPRAVLSGGRYDGLLERFGLSLPALGFALYLGELERYFGGTENGTPDAVLVYGGAAAETVRAAAERLRRGGLRVRVQQCLPGPEEKGLCYVLRENGEMEVSGLA